MRILAFTEDSPYIAGANLVFVRLCRLIGAKHDVVLLSNNGSTEKLLGPSKMEIRFNLPRYPFSRFISVMVFLFSKGLKEALKRDVILANSGMTAPIALALARVARRRIVVYQHDIFYLERNKGIRRIIAATIRFQMYQGFLKYFDAVMVPSLETKRRVRNFGCKNIFFVGNPIFGEEYA